MSSVQITVKGLTRVKAKAKELDRLFQDLRPILAETEKEFQKMIEANFASQGPPGERWAKHSRYTRIMRAEGVGTYKGGGGGNRILIWKGGLLRSFTSGKNAIFKIITSGSNFEIQMGSSNPLAKLHHEGLTFHRGGVKPKSRRGRKRKARMLAFYNAQGQIVFTRFSSPTSITIPARPFWSKSQAQDLVQSNKRRIQYQVRKIWNG
jgi:hypothetical protein